MLRLVFREVTLAAIVEDGQGWGWGNREAGRPCHKGEKWRVLLPAIPEARPPRRIWESRMGQEAAATYGSPFWVTTREKVILQMEAGIVDIGHTDLCQTLGWVICLIKKWR